MPTTIQVVLKQSPCERIDQFRRKIPNGVGYEMCELAELPEIASHESYIRDICSRNRWAVKQWSATKRRSLILLVNPKTLAKNATQGKK